jgi:translation initiation factor IF-3
MSAKHYSCAPLQICSLSRELLDLCNHICYNCSSEIKRQGDYPISPSNKYTRLNGAIRALELRVIDAEGKQLGVLSRTEALRLAEEQGLDLVEISPDAKPPVAKIIDWGKFNYQRTKQQQKNRKTAKTLEVKQIRLGLKIGEHDLQTKLGKVTKFLEIGHKVKITVFFRGRELAHKDIGFKLADNIIARFGESIVIDQQPQLAGKQLSFVVRANPSARAAQSKVAAAAANTDDSNE